MSKFSKKGYRNMLGRDENDQLKVVSMKIGSKPDKLRAHYVHKSKREATKAFREYKANLKKLKKKVPAHLRANINWSKTPDLFLGGQEGGDNNNTEAKPMH